MLHTRKCDGKSPLMSSISLGDKYRVLDLSLLHVRSVELAIFSACLTGQGQATPSGDILWSSHATLASGSHVYMEHSAWPMIWWHPSTCFCIICVWLVNLRSPSQTTGQLQRGISTSQSWKCSQSLQAFRRSLGCISSCKDKTKFFCPWWKEVTADRIRRLGTKRG